MGKTENSPASRQFKYQREDFGALPVKLEHLTICINFAGEKVETSGLLQMSALTALDELILDARDLEITSVEWLTSQEDEQGSQLAFEYRREKDKLAVKLPRRVEAGERFFVRTQSRCTPTEHILEGIYKDTTPPGAPQQFISQCQQWGFQRIMPIFDDCRAKCTMTTTIEADAAYTHLISNGNVCKSANPGGVPVQKPGDPSRQRITYENPVPMAPYLFFVAAGTWDMLVDEVSYPSVRKVRLEYLVPPGSTEEARVPMAILKDSVLWVGKTQDYEYEFDTYRTICMTKSNFGGMENLGNTTIVTDAALITEHTLDHLLLYAHAVIVHEFEHNQCGSETTMETPFDVWLNEAYTVDVERQFMADLFDPAFVRLNQVDSIRAPLLGPLTIEDAGHFGRIVREGFNDPEELIDGVTYVKAAEVIRMLRLIIGPEAFVAGKRLYFSRYRAGNANTDQFFECFEEVSGVSLTQFKSEWLYRIGYPKVSAVTEYDKGAGRFHIRIKQEKQEGLRPFFLPIALSLVDEKGLDIEGTERVIMLNEFETEVVFENLNEPPAFASMNRDSSFYGTFRHENADEKTLSAQARLDPNAYNRVDAMRKLTDRQRVKLLNDPAASISSEWLDLYGVFLSDKSLPASLKANFIRIDEQPVDRSYATWYLELVAARDKLMSAVNARFRDELVAEFRSLGTAEGKTMRQGIEERMLKGVLLELIAVDDTKDSHRIILSSLEEAKTATERVSALTALNRSAEPSRKAVLEKYYENWHGHLSGYANYLRVVSSGTGADVFDEIEAEKSRKSFDINQPTWCRALFLTMAGNNRMVWTGRGIQWVADTVVSLAPINATTASRLLNTFQHVRSLKPQLKEKVTAALEQIVRLVTIDACASIHGQASTYLKGVQE
ncbi:MAG: peptidase M1 [Deltaproteobacteria bacterium GWA2_54_12]|nr:MAG: peptidase M1 [Deltaproteobacteria bacterium GWA2_54_12]